MLRKPITKNGSIEFGSTTSPKLIPQMEHSFELWNYIKTLDNNKKINNTMLVPSINHLDKCLELNINSYGIVSSISDAFSEKNMKTTSIKSFENAKLMIEKIINNNRNSHIRVYISCCFGCPWDSKSYEGILSKEYLRNLDIFLDDLKIIIKKYNLIRDNFDIVLSDTIGVCSRETLKEVLSFIEEPFKKYTALHLHFPSKNGKQRFEKIVDLALDENIRKFDSSLLGIGGCPYAKKKETTDIIGNLSTIPFLEYLEKNGFETGIDLGNLKENSREIQAIIM